MAAQQSQTIGGLRDAQFPLALAFTRPFKKAGWLKNNITRGNQFWWLRGHLRNQISLPL